MAPDPVLQAAPNLARFHREHEKYYSAAPLEDALKIQRSSRALKALAERWTRADPATPVPSPFAGAEDLNDERALAEAGVLFMEGEGEPAEIARIKRGLRTIAEESEQTGDWLDGAMAASWGAAETQVGHSELAEVLGERHRIIANDWQAAQLSRLTARLLQRSLRILEEIDFSPAALREDLAGSRRSAAYLFSASELMDRAADLSLQSGMLVHDNERRWRLFRERIEALGY